MSRICARHGMTTRSATLAASRAAVSDRGGVSGARLRVGIEDDNRVALADGFDGEGEARLADAASLREQGYDLHS